MNSMRIIVPYKYEGMWVFDDPAVNLDREPFVAGIDQIIDRLVASIPGVEKGFRLLFVSWRHHFYHPGWDKCGGRL